MKILGWRRVSDEERVAQASMEAEQLARIRDLVGRPSFRSLVVDWLVAQIDGLRVRAGDERSMLYEIGRRDGLEIVLAYMRDLEQRAKRSDD